jgi:hypothetical protein
MNTKPLLLTIACFGLAGCAAGVSAPPTADFPAHPGFDTWQYPGDDVVLAWRDASPYRWIGFYLPSPCHRDTSFSGKRQFLAQAGWGMAVLYVGQQTFDGEEPAEITDSTLCSSALLTTEQGVLDGRDAIARAAAEGFPPGTTIFLDIERMQTITPAMVDYYQSWIRTVLEDGRYGVGTYAHRTNAAGLYTVAQRLVGEGGESESIPFWIAGGSGFSLSSRPRDAGLPFTTIWQGVLDTSRTWGGRTLVVDENVAESPSPSVLLVD